MRLFRLGLACLVGLLVNTDVCRAELMLQVSDAGGGNTTWTWGGSALATLSGDITSGTFIEWGQNSAHNITTTNFGMMTASSGGGLFSNDTLGTSTVFTTAFYDDNPGPDDEIGFIAPATATVTWSNGDTISLSGTMTVPIPITELDESPLPFAGMFGTGMTFCGLPSSCGLPSLHVSIVPEPSSVTLSLWLTLGLARFRRTGLL